MIDVELIVWRARTFARRAWQAWAGEYQYFGERRKIHLTRWERLKYFVRERGGVSDE